MGSFSICILAKSFHESQKLKSYILLDARKGLTTSLLSEGERERGGGGKKGRHRVEKGGERRLERREEEGDSGRERERRGETKSKGGKPQW